MVKKYNVVLVIFSFILIWGNCAYAHSGRTDSSGGHKDNKNVSGLGNYHFHCNGNPAHLHSNGICPYDRASMQPVNEQVQNEKVKNEQVKNNQEQNAVNINDKNKQEDIQTTNNTQVEEKIERVKIIYDTKDMNINDKQTLNANTFPEGAKKEKIVWTSSDKDVITIDNNGNMIAKSEGRSIITVIVNEVVRDVISVNVKPSNDNKIETITPPSNNQVKSKEQNNNGGFIVGVVSMIGVIGIVYIIKHKK